MRETNIIKSTWCFSCPNPWSTAILRFFVFFIIFEWLKKIPSLPAYFFSGGYFTPNRPKNFRTCKKTPLLKPKIKKKENIGLKVVQTGKKNNFFCWFVFDLKTNLVPLLQNLYVNLKQKKKVSNDSPAH